jgi:hypothetical protein
LGLGFHSPSIKYVAYLWLYTITDEAILILAYLNMQFCINLSENQTLTKHFKQITLRKHENSVFYKHDYYKERKGGENGGSPSGFYFLRFISTYAATAIMAMTTTATIAYTYSIAKPLLLVFSVAIGAAVVGATVGSVVAGAEVVGKGVGVDVSGAAVTDSGLNCVYVGL